MVLFLRKYFWALNFVVITICAFLAANALSSYVAASLPLRLDKPALPARISAASGQSGPTSRDITTILHRNIFCSSCDPGEQLAAELTEDPNRPPPTANGEQPVKTSLQLKLIATLVSAEDDALNLAAINDLANDKTQIYGIGYKVPGDAVITDIADRHVLLLTGKRSEYLPLDADSDEAGAAGTAVAQEGAAPRYRLPTPLPGLERVADGIKRLTGTSYEIRRDLVDEIFGNRSLLARGGRIVPVMRNGRPAGFRFFGRKGSVGSMIGLFGGDTIKSINGRSVITPEQALEVFSKLKGASYISLGLERKGQEISHEYHIR